MNLFNCGSVNKIFRASEHRRHGLKTKETLLYFLIGIPAAAAIGWLFYKSLAVSAVLAAVPFFTFNRFRDYMENRRREEMNMQFKDVLYAFSDSAAAGKSAGAAIESAWKNLRKIYGDDNLLTQRFCDMSMKIRETNASPETVLLDFGLDCEVEDIRNFIEIYCICLTSGGDREKAISKAASIIGEKINLRLELSNILAQKKLEATILCSITPVILLFLQVTSSDYTEVLYTTGAGRLIMTGCMIAAAFAASLCLKIMDIRI